MPEVSVIVPNFNHGPYLARRLESIFAQAFSDFEVIILDDNSTDDSKEVIRRYEKEPRVSQVIVNTANSGSPFLQWKRGLELATGKLVWIAESDDYAAPTFLSRLVPLLRGDVKMAYCASQNVDQNGQPIQGLDQWLAEVSAEDWKQDYVISGPEEVSHHLSIRNTVANTSSVVLEKSLCLRHLNALDGFRSVGDWYLWLNVLSDPGVSMAYCSARLNFFRSHDVTTRYGRTTFDYLEEWWRCLSFGRKEKNQGLHPLARKDLKAMAMRIPARKILSPSARKSLMSWMRKDPLFPRIVLRSLLERVPIWLKRKSQAGETPYCVLCIVYCVLV